MSLPKSTPASQSAGTRHHVPFDERPGSQQAVMRRPQQVSAYSEEILYRAVYRREALQLSSGLEPSHLPLTLSCRLVRDFCAVVGMLSCAVDHRRHHRAARGWVTAELVGNQPTRHAALAFQQLPEEPHRSATIPPRLHQGIEGVTVLVHRTPEILLVAVERDEEFVEMPRITLLTAPAPERTGIARTERQTAGWPGEVTLPGLPQIRTCPIRASGSSAYGLAARR